MINNEIRNSNPLNKLQQFSKTLTTLYLLRAFKDSLVLYTPAQNPQYVDLQERNCIKKVSINHIKSNQIAKCKPHTTWGTVCYHFFVIPIGKRLIGLISFEVIIWHRYYLGLANGIFVFIRLRNRRFYRKVNKIFCAFAWLDHSFSTTLQRKSWEWFWHYYHALVPLVHSPVKSLNFINILKYCTADICS